MINILQILGILLIFIVALSFLSKKKEIQYKLSGFMLIFIGVITLLSSFLLLEDLSENPSNFIILLIFVILSLLIIYMGYDLIKDYEKSPVLKFGRTKDEQKYKGKLFAPLGYEKDSKKRKRSR